MISSGLNPVSSFRPVASLGTAAAGAQPSPALNALMAVMSACAPDLCAHARRVSRTATAVAMTMNLPVPLAEQIEQAALLHDIGKLATAGHHSPSYGPGEELQAVLARHHVRVGFDVLSVVPSLRPAASIVIAVLERWDGSGYPAGFCGTEISLGARI